MGCSGSKVPEDEKNKSVSKKSKNAASQNERNKNGDSIKAGSGDAETKKEKASSTDPKARAGKGGEERDAKGGPNMSSTSSESAERNVKGNNKTKRNSNPNELESLTQLSSFEEQVSKQESEEKEIKEDSLKVSVNKDEKVIAEGAEAKQTETQAQPDQKRQLDDASEVEKPATLEMGISTTTESKDELNKGFNVEFSRLCRASDYRSLLNRACDEISSLVLAHDKPKDFPFKELFMNIPCLEILDLKNCRIGPLCFRALIVAVATNSSLKQLDISGNCADTECSKALGVLFSKNSSLEQLDISFNSLGKDFLSRNIGKELGTNTTVREFRMNSVGAIDVECIIEGLCVNQHLRIFEMAGNTIGDPLGLQIKNMLLSNPSSSLSSVDVSSTGMEDEGVLAVAENLANLKSLKCLRIGGNDVAQSKTIVWTLCLALSHPSLEEIDLSLMKLIEPGKDESCFDDPPLPEDTFTNMKIIRMNNCDVSDEGILCITDKVVPHFSCSLKLEVLELSRSTPIAGEAVSSLSKTLNKDLLTKLKLSLGEQSSLELQMANLKSVVALDLSSSERKAALDFVFGGVNATLEDLRLNSIKLEPEDVTEIFSKAQFNIKSLDLSSCKLSDAQISSLSKCRGRLESLEELLLSGNQIGDDSIVQLSRNLLPASSIKNLDLSINSIGDIGAQGIASCIMSGKSSLVTVRLSNNAIGPNGLGALLDAVCDPVSNLEHLDLKMQNSTLSETEFANATKSFIEYWQNDHVNNPKTKSIVVNLQKLGGFGSLFQNIASASLITDYAELQYSAPIFQSVLDLSVCLGEVPFSEEEWDIILGKDVPLWTKSRSHRHRGIYIANLAPTMTINTVTGMLEMDADCCVEEVVLMKDPLLRLPNGIAFVLMEDEKSVERALDFFYSGEATKFGQAIHISSMRIELLGEPDDAQDQSSVQRDIAKRARKLKACRQQDASAQAEAAALAKERADYRAAHPAYQNGLIS
eukprot:Nk52_evm65s745 gene=Nk52_evmTU65s745